MGRGSKIDQEARKRFWYGAHSSARRPGPLNKRAEDCPPYLARMNNYRRLAQAPLQHERLLAYALWHYFI